MKDRQNDNLFRLFQVVDAIRISRYEREPRILVNLRKEPWLVGDPLKDIFDRGSERRPKPSPTLLIPVCGIIELSPRDSPEDDR